jgi:hypothetical protein
MNGPDARRARVLALVAATPSPTRPEVRRRAIALAALSVAFALAWYRTAGAIDPGAGLPRPLGVAIAASFALGSAAIAWLVLRHGPEPRAPAAIGAGFGAASGAWAAVLLHLVCPPSSLGDAIARHLVPLLALLLLGAAASAVRPGVRVR